MFGVSGIPAPGEGAERQLGSRLAAESLSLHKATERRHRAGREFGHSYPRQKRGKIWAAGG